MCERYRMSEGSAWVLERVSHLSWGMKTDEGLIRRINYNRSLLTYVKKLDYGVMGRKVRRLGRMDLELHGFGATTVYIEASMYADEILVGIDIDNHAGTGTLADAILVAQALRDQFFPNLYFEPSTNGNGVHGYLRFTNPDDPLKAHRALDSFELFLKRFVRDGNARGLWNVEDIEVKGKPAEVVRDGEGRAANFRAGTLIKAPRGLVERADELMATTVVTADFLLGLKMKPVPRSTRPSPAVSRGRTAAVEEPEASGSRGGRIFDEERLAGLLEGGKYHTLARCIAGEGYREVAHAKDRKVVVEEDVRIFLMLFEHFEKNPNADGSLPGDRWEKLWTKLYRGGYIGRAFNWMRFARLRNLLSKHRYIDWTRTEYTAKWTSQDGKRVVKGEACRWKMAPILKYALSSFNCNPPATASSPQKTTTNLALRITGLDASAAQVLGPVAPLDDFPRPRFAGWAIGRPQLAA